MFYAQRVGMSSTVALALLSGYGYWFAPIHTGARRDLDMVTLWLHMDWCFACSLDGFSFVIIKL